MGNNKKYAVLSLSGGLDSSTLLLHLLAEGFQVQCLSFDYGQKHKIELEKAKELVEYVNGIQGMNHDVLVKHQIIKLDGLSSLLNSTLVEGGSEVPEGHYEEANQRLTVVPNRNKIFSSIIQAVALSIADKNNSECKIALGIHANDSSVYPDCRPEFRDSDYQTFLLGNWGGEKVTYYTPYLNGGKFEILQDGERCCKYLGLDFNEVYKKTNTSYKPIFISFNNKKPRDLKDYHIITEEDMKGQWYSDFKSASSVERVEAFIKLGRPDPSPYAEILPNGEAIPRTWEEVVNHVTHILKENEILKKTFN